MKYEPNPENKFIFLGRTSESKQNLLGVNSRWPDIWMVPWEGVIWEGETIQIPPSVSEVKPEIELAVVVGKKCFDVTPSEALNFLKGVTICNDLTVRSEWPGYSDPKFGRSGFGYKMFPTFSPIFSQMQPINILDNYKNLQMKLTLDNKVIVKSSPIEYKFSLGDMVSFASRICILNEGDFISLGGVGNHEEYIDDYTNVSCEIHNIGKLENKIARI